MPVHIVRLHYPGPAPPAVYPGPCSGWSGRSLVVAVAGSSARPEECRHLRACLCDLVYFFWSAPAPPGLNVLGGRLRLYQGSLAVVLEILHLEGEEGEFCNSFHPLLRFPL